MRNAPGISHKIWSCRFLTALVLWAGFSTSMLGQSRSFDRSGSVTEDWALPWTALTIAPDGSWVWQLTTTVIKRSQEQ